LNLSQFAEAIAAFGDAAIQVPVSKHAKITSYWNAFCLHEVVKRRVSRAFVKDPPNWPHAILVYRLQRVRAGGAGGNAFLKSPASPAKHSFLSIFNERYKTH
jgi:hypothetical protein